jgi:type I restriction enzyme, S subunit
MPHPQKSLSEICTPKQWPTIPMKDLEEDGFPVYGANGIIGYYHEYNHENPTILITCRGATCGTVNVCAPKSYVTGNAMCLDNLKEEVVDLDYLRHFLKSRGLDDVITGSAQPQITRTNLSRIMVPLPPLKEQKRIAAILDKAEQTIQSSIRSLNSKSGLITSTFIEMFGDSFTNSKNWEMKPLGELGLHISDGNYSAKYPKVTDFVKEGVPFLRANNLKNLSVNDDDMRHIPTDLHNNVLLKGHVKVNDILITTRGNIGQVGIVPKRHDDSNINAQLVLLRTEGSEIHHHYLLSVLDSEGLQHQFRKLQTGTALKQLPVSKLRKAIIPLPPMDLQISFSNLFNQMNSQISNALIELESLEALFSSLAQDLIA